MTAKDTIFYTKKTLNINGKLIDLISPLVMGILNITPDSFYDGGQYLNEEDILRQAKKMIDEGSDIIDIGGYSSRPGADAIPEDIELSRVLPAIEIIKKYYPTCIISIDTFRSGVARASVAKGASIVNDISGGDLDKTMFETIAELNVPYVLMHTRGNPATMMEFTQYSDVALEVIDELQKKIKKLNALGVKDIIIDPGFGFAKTIEQNYELLEKLNYFHVLGVPILIGLSRKSMIYRLLQIEAKESLNATTVLNTIAIMKGASILRVHDVKEAKEILQLVKMINN